MKHFLLSLPAVYKVLQKCLVRNNTDIFRKNLTVKENGKVLDIGCGPGTVLDSLPETVEYHGFDLSEAYINDALKKYGHRKAYFKCAMVESETLDPALLGSFDLVIAMGVLHHLNDDSVKQLAHLAWSALKPGGVFVTFDPCFLPGQNIIARTLARLDRGQFVRYPEPCRALVESAFEGTVEMDFCHNALRLPYDHLILRMTKAGG